MVMIYCLLVLFLSLADPNSAWQFHTNQRHNPHITAEKMSSIEKAKMSPDQYKKVEHLHLSWYVEAVSGLLGAVGKELYKKMDLKNQKAFIECLDAISNDDDITSSAKCLTKAIDKRLVHADVNDRPNSVESDWVGGFRLFRPLKSLKRKKINKKTFKKKIDLKNRKAFIPYLDVIDNDDHQGSSAMRLEKILRKRRKPNVLNQSRLVNQEPNSFDDEHIKSSPNLKSLADPAFDHPPSSIQKISKFLTNLVHALDKDAQQRSSWSDVYARLSELKNIVEETRQMSRYRHRVLDIVLGEHNAYRRRKTVTQRIRSLVPRNSGAQIPLFEDTLKLVDVLGKDSEANLRFFSPRFASVVPTEAKNTKHLFSPNILPFYNDNSPNTVLPIPKLLEATDLEEEDKKAVLQLIMEASGARQVADEAFKLLKNAKSLGLDDDITDITRLISQTFKQVERSFTGSQKRQMDVRKYTFLRRDQLEMIYGEKGVYSANLKDFPIDLDEYERWTEVERKKALYETIRNLAEENSPKSGRRAAEEEFGEILMPTTLAPFAFAPDIGTITVLGPITLPPNIFSPSILAPLVLSPPVLSPAIASPLIFSPFVFGPNVLSPQIFDVYIFNPYVLSPNVLNPWVLSPLILSPHVLCPDLMSPTLLSGTILNPFVGSPAILTESALAIDVLSPSFLS